MHRKGSTLRASIVVIGDEILDGFVRDSNAAWLATRLREVGIPLDRISVVPDEVAAICEALRAEIARSRPRVLFTSGGIGTTPDDRTMAAVARFLGVELVAEPTLRQMVDGIIDRLIQRGHEVDDAQRRALRKLAQVPQGARALTGPDGTAPGVRLDVDGGDGVQGGLVLVVLPGVPSQFRDLVTQLEPTLLAGRGVVLHVAELRHPYPESVLTPALEALDVRFPQVRIGSYPGTQCLLRVQGETAAVEAVIAELRRTLDDLADDPRMRELAAAWRHGWRDA